MVKSKAEIASLWLEAINDATFCLRSQIRGDVQAAQDSLLFLNDLERILRKREKIWDRLPMKPPPRLQFAHANVEERKFEETAPVTLATDISNTNPFALIQDLDDSDEESSDEEDDLEEAGDIPAMLVTGMVMRRLMIRIVTFQSELFAYMSQGCRHCRVPEWKRGSAFCATAVQKIHQALILADSEISRWIQNENPAIDDLMEDADIVAVAIQSLTEESDRFRQEAERQKMRLQRRLQPQWSSRDTVKTRMGDKWYNNPHPKQTYAQKREQDEKQLKEIETALLELQGLDTESLKTSSNELRRRVLTKGEPSGQDPASHRHNGIRPTDLSRRVSLPDYPDPTDFGWIFTGSAPNVEFFEREEVKLDWYYTTGTLKTSMDHPAQGKTQLFAAGEKLTPDLYRRILINPREHTDIRYQSRRGRNRKGNSSAK